MTLKNCHVTLELSFCINSKHKQNYSCTEYLRRIYQHVGIFVSAEYIVYNVLICAPKSKNKKL